MFELGPELDTTGWLVPTSCCRLASCCLLLTAMQRLLTTAIWLGMGALGHERSSDG